MASTPQLHPVSFSLFLNTPVSLLILTVNYLLLGVLPSRTRDELSDERPSRVGFAQKGPGLGREPFLHLSAIDMLSMDVTAGL